MKRSKTSKAWMHSHVTDPYVRQARQHGFRSRAAYKLMEIDARDHLLKPGRVVVDLGAAPGGWSQVAVQKVGPRGRVIAVDLLEMTPIPGVEFLCGDLTDPAVLAGLKARLAGQPVDLVICDMAPNLSGVAVADQAKSQHLAELALDFAVTHLQPGGAFVVKLFQGEGFDAFVRAASGHFRQVDLRKPEASRSRSRELYLVAKGRVGRLPESD